MRLHLSTSAHLTTTPAEAMSSISQLSSTAQTEPSLCQVWRLVTTDGPLFINDCTRCQHPVTDVFLSINSVRCFHWAVFVQYYWECLMLRASVVLCWFEHSIRRDCYDSFHNFSMLLLFCVAFLSIYVCTPCCITSNPSVFNETNNVFYKSMLTPLANDPTTVTSVCLCFLTADNVRS